MGHWGRMRMWLLAIAVAIVGTSALAYLGQVDLAKWVQQRPNLPWLSLLVGGAVFGVGMPMAGGCANRNLIRAGAGSVRSLVVLVFMAISAYMTLKGLFGVWRVNTIGRFAFRVDKAQDIPTLLAAAFGWERGVADPWLPLAIALLLLAFVLANRHAWQRDTLVGGVVVGLTVVGGWYVTGHLGYVAEHPKTLEEAFIDTTANRPRRS